MEIQREKETRHGIKKRIPLFDLSKEWSSRMDYKIDSWRPRKMAVSESLWYRVIQALYGASFELHPVNQSSIWCSILREMFPLLFSLEMDKESTVASKLGCSSVDDSFRRSIHDGVERQQWDDLNSVSHSVTLSASKDRWICDLNGDGMFCVKEVRTILDDIFLPSAADAMRWVKYISIKINVFAWRARLDRLPTRSNLVHRGVVLDSSLCPFAFFTNLFVADNLCAGIAGASLLVVPRILHSLLLLQDVHY
nr:RNA-directed DNA polymerase, eukaryota [Tanacetum cinerariifolium]